MAIASVKAAVRIMAVCTLAAASGFLAMAEVEVAPIQAMPMAAKEGPTIIVNATAKFLSASMPTVVEAACIASAVSGIDMGMRGRKVGKEIGGWRRFTMLRGFFGRAPAWRDHALHGRHGRS